MTSGFKASIISQHAALGGQSGFFIGQSSFTVTGFQPMLSRITLEAEPDRQLTPFFKSNTVNPHAELTQLAIYFIAMKNCVAVHACEGKSLGNLLA